ncbi:hypothetical protein L323_13505 [Ruminiclostridium papyrosolvens C7]|uniref:Uncharacterized protein n=1 Tax=Ruminiclostridium papyrosolvens C7 TaxID=1330534 RepID=U4R0A7_9FIRM|nr:hypothetical protein L323_13505 [Ruminiclostridium papyrosolvens C7]
MSFELSHTAIQNGNMPEYLLTMAKLDLLLIKSA